MRKITIRVGRTTQVERYEPVSVEVEETITVADGEDVAEARMELYKGVTKFVKNAVDNEVRKYRAAKKAERDEQTDD